MSQLGDGDSRHERTHVNPIVNEPIQHGSLRPGMEIDSLIKTTTNPARRDERTRVKPMENEPIQHGSLRPGLRPGVEIGSLIEIVFIPSKGRDITLPVLFRFFAVPFVRPKGMPTAYSRRIGKTKKRWLSPTLFKI